MLETLGIVQLPAQNANCQQQAARSLGGTSLLEWVVRRVTDCQTLDGVIVALGDSEADIRLARLVPPDVPVFHYSGDPLARVVNALEEFPATAVVRVCLDSLFIDPDLIDRLVVTSRDDPQCDYATYRARDGRPAILSPLGVFAEWCSSDALRRADAATQAKGERANVTQYVFSHPEVFKLRLIPAPEQLDRDDVRLAIESAEDWENARTICDALGTDELDWQRIAGLLDGHPDLRRRMASLNRACASVH